MRRKKKSILMILCILIIGCLGQTNSIIASDEVGNEQIVKQYDELKYYDVVVCGAEPEGIAASVSAARRGLKVLLIDKRNKLGGIYTSGMLVMLDLNNDEGREALPVVNQGLFARMYKAIGYNGAIDCNQTALYFEKLLANNNVDVLCSVDNIETEVSNGIVKGISFKHKGKVIQVHSDYVIDAMQDAPIARMSGADYWVGREDLGLNQYGCSTLVFSMGGVNWKKVCRYLENDNRVDTGHSDDTAWGYAELLGYQPVTSSTDFQLRGLNLARQKDGTVVINAFQVFGVDSLSDKSKKQAYEAAKKELTHVVEYLNKHAAGFENAYLAKVADELYIREGVRIVGEQTLTGEDCLAGKNFSNKIAYGSYPIDLQSCSRDRAGGNGLNITSGYTIPMGVMLPTKLENVLVVGRSASYDSIAHGSARTVPVGIALGEAAGEICYISKGKGVSLKTINSDPIYYKIVQNNLIDLGVTLNDPIEANLEEQKNWSYSAIQNLRKQGFLSKIHNARSTYECNKVATGNTFSGIVSLIKSHSKMPVNMLYPIKDQLSGKLTKQKIIQILNQILDTKYHDLEGFYESGILTQSTYQIIKETTTFYNSHVYLIMSNVVDYLRIKTPLPSKEAIIHNDLNK